MRTVEQVDISDEWLKGFEAAAQRPLEMRLRYAFIHTYKPVLDDATYRAFDTMEDYRRWCEEKLPDWLGDDIIASKAAANRVRAALARFPHLLDAEAILKKRFWKRCWYENNWRCDCCPL